MTEKRFKLIGDSNFQMLMQNELELPIYDYYNNKKRLSLKNTLDLLNQLSKENEQLKCNNQKAIDLIYDAIVEMHDGKRDYAETIFYKAIELIK